MNLRHNKFNFHRLFFCFLIMIVTGFVASSQNYPVAWAGGVGIDVDIETLDVEKIAASAWGNAGAHSINKLATHEDGYVSFVVDDDTGSKCFGLSSEDIDPHFNTIQYSMLLRFSNMASNGKRKFYLSIYENGIAQLSNKLVYEGDELKLKRNGTQLTYLVENKKIWGRPVSIIGDWIVDIALFDFGSTFKNIKASFEVEDPAEVEMNELKINTEQLPGGIFFSVEIDGVVSSHESGSIATIPFPFENIGKRGKTVNIFFDFEEQTHYLSNITFHINYLFEFSDVRAAASYGGRPSEFSLNPVLYEIEGNQISFHPPDVNEQSISSSGIYPILENGLVLSPNGDDAFDELQIAGVEYINNYRLTIFDENASIIFETFEKSTYWDGTDEASSEPVPIGQYSFEIEADATIINGSFLVDY